MTRVLAIADTDSYLKWSAATLATLPGHWERTQLVIENPVMPSAAQIIAATRLPVEVLRRSELRRRIRQLRPDVVLLAATGPVVADLAADPLFQTPTRPVLLTGLPGISVPATRSAVRHRKGCDLFVLHSHREIAEFAELARTFAPALDFGLARLPFLHASRPTGDDRRDLVFAAQAKVPPAREDREQIVLALAAAGDAVIKVRALADEQQTHREEWPYPQLLAELLDEGRIEPDAVRCVGGGMADALAQARGLVTVSSTAALEAMAGGIPVLIITDFGVSAQMINLVFEGSGCLGSLADLPAGRIRLADPAWLDANYFHPVRDNDWIDQLIELLDRRATAGLPRPIRSSSARKRLRRRLRLLIPPTTARRLIQARGWLRVQRSALAGRPPGRTAPELRRDLRDESAAAVPAAGSPAERQPRTPASPPASSAQHH